MAETGRGETIDGFLERLASRDPTPAGGAVAALQVAQAAALVAMVGRFSAVRPGDPAVADAIAATAAGAVAATDPDAVVQRAEELRREARVLAAEDESAFAQVAAAYRLPRDTEPAREVRAHAITQALTAAARPPAAVVEVAGAVVHLAEHLVGVASPSTVPDLAAAVETARVAATTSGRNVRANLARPGPAGRPAELADVAKRVDEIQRRAGTLLDTIDQRLT